MTFSVQYDVSHAQSLSAYRQRIRAFVWSAKGAVAIIAASVFAYAGTWASRIPEALGVVPESAMLRLFWRSIAFFGWLPMVCLAVAGIVGITQYRKMKNASGATTSVRIALTIDDDGLTFASAHGTQSVAWEEIRKAENLPDFFIFSYGQTATFIPKKELPDEVSAFVRSKTLRPKSLTKICRKNRVLLLFVVVALVTAAVMRFLERNETTASVWRTDNAPMVARFPALGDDCNVMWQGRALGNSSRLSVPGPSGYSVQCVVPEFLKVYPDVATLSDFIQEALPEAVVFPQQLAGARATEWISSETLDTALFPPQYQGRAHYAPKRDLLYFDVFWQ